MILSTIKHVPTFQQRWNNNDAKQHLSKPL